MTWQLIVGLVTIGVCRTSPSACAQGTPSSAYTLATTSVTIVYNTGPDPTGAIKINTANPWPSPNMVDIRLDPPDGLIPNTVAVTCVVTYNGNTGQYPAPKDWSTVTVNNKGVYSINIEDLAKWLVGEIDKMLPPQFDPHAAPSFSTTADVAFTVTPGDVPGFKSSATNVTTPLKITLQQVLGVPMDAAAVLPKTKAASTDPSTSRQAAPQLATLGPQCGTGGGEFACGLVSHPCLLARSTVAVASCPVATYTPMPMYCYSTLSYSPSTGRTCWP